MRGLSRHLSERTRLKPIASLVVGACLGTGMLTANAGSLLEPGTTTYTYALLSDVPLEIGAAHTLVLDTEDSSFLLEAPLINHGVVHVAATGQYGEALVLSSAAQTNQGQWIVDNSVRMYLEGGLDNHGGVLQIGTNSSVFSTTQSIVGGRIHGVASTSNLSAHSLKDVTITGQVNLLPWKLPQGTTTPGAVGGTLTVDGTLRVTAMNLSESTLLRGTGRTALNNATIEAEPGAATPKLTIEAGHTLSGTGRITDVALLNRGTLEVNAGEWLQVNSAIVQEGDDALLVVKSTMQAPEIQIKGGAIELDKESYVKGGVDVQKGRLVLHELQLGSDGWAYQPPVIDGDLSLSDQSELEVVVTGDLSLAVLDVSGKASLGGDLIISFADGAKMQSTFDLLVAASSVQGAFRSVRVNGAGDLPWTFRQQRNGAIEVAMVPEPETWGLMLCGLGVVAWRLRRRTAHQSAH